MTGLGELAVPVVKGKRGGPTHLVAGRTCGALIRPAY